MADTPRVTVPVEQPLVDWFSQFIERHQEGCGSDTDALIACLDRVRDSYQVRSAAPAPEGGAVDALEIVRDPTVEGAKRFVGIATREEAPADTTDCKRCAGNGEIVTDWDEYLSPPKGAPADHATADCPDCGGIGKVEAPAEWFGVTGAVDETEALAVALFDVRCPGVRMTDEDLHYYRAAAQRAMQAVTDELDTPALATRSDDKPEGVAVEALREVLIQADLKIRSLPGTDQSDVEFIREVLATREEAPAEAGDAQKLIDDLRYVYSQMTPSALERMDSDGAAIIIERTIEYLRAQPPAREDAQPVGWLRAVDEEMVCAHLGVADAEDSFETAKKKLASLIQWNIAVATDPSVGGHPAPDAQPLGCFCDEASCQSCSSINPAPDALRDVARHAATVMRYLDEHGASIVPHLIDTDDNPGQRLRDALAALQAEQKGGA